MAPHQPLLSPTSIRKLTLLLRSSPRAIETYFPSHIRPYSSSSTSSPSVSPAEVSHFNALASTWWDPHGPSRLLHLMNPLRHDFIRACHQAPQPYTKLSDEPQKLTYLDVGCGGGIFAESAARLASTARVTGIDPSAEVLAIAKSHARRDPALCDKLRYLNTSIEGLPVPRPGIEEGKDRAEQVDVLSVFEVLEHVQDPATFLDECSKHVKPGGWMVLSTIARHWVSWVTTKVMAEELLGVVPRGTHEWAKYINEEELRGYFEGTGGWNSLVCMGVVYVPGLGWKEVSGSERVGNYFFGARKDEI